MKHIKKIILKNFQSHKYTEIELSKKLNIIVGSSDSGKTAIIRAIKWALYNEPAGDYFLREGEREVSVTLIFSDNIQVIRYRSKTKNIYELTYSSGEELRFEGFGTGVPEEIQEAIGIYKINMDGKETNAINLAEQLEGPFLLSEKTSTRASAIGQLVGVNVIDEALRETLKDARALNVTKKNLEEDINQLNDEIETYDYLEDLKNTINKISVVKEDIVKSQKLLDILNRNYFDLRRLSEEIEGLTQIRDDLSRLNDIDNILVNLERFYIKYWHLSSHDKNMKKIKSNRKSNESILEKLKDLDNVLGIENKLLVVTKEYSALLNLNTQYKNIQAEIPRLNNKLKYLSKYLKYENSIIEIQNVYQRLTYLINYKDKYIKIKSSIDKGQVYLERFEFLDRITNDKEKLEEKMELLRKLNKHYNKILINKKDIESEEETLKKLNIENEKVLNEYKCVLNKIERCPLCFGEINNDKIEHILDHYIGG